MKILSLLLFFVSLLFSASKPDLLLLNNYTKDMNVTGWYMSEKLDGVRAYWNGSEFISRSGRVIAAPDFFTQGFPSSELDGELWSKRGDFVNIASIVNKKVPDRAWRELTFNVFEVPHKEGDLLSRLKSVQNSSYIRVIQQIKVKDREALHKFLKDVESKGGEGVVVRDGSLPYYYGRTNDALKVKSYVDEECQVVGEQKGKGKNKGKMGSLLCKMNSGKIIKIGSGFTQEERANPPKQGTLITFKYYGLTSKGNPRFPIFIRKR